MKKDQITYVALLRGINVGGNHIVRMEELRKAFKVAGYSNISTLLATGNVIFDSPSEDLEELTDSLEIFLKKRFGFEIPVLLRTMDNLKKLHNSEPFKGIKVTNETRFYVSFLSEPKKASIPIPYESEGGFFRILSATPEIVCSVLIVSPTSDTVKLMNTIERVYGKRVTTRNWNTIKKLVAL
ncbi:MAG: DUF1697 domain-containing protein [Candidatus Dojkabacteria bacterium]